MRDYKKIKAFQLANQFVIEIYKITKSFPVDETYGLTSQIRRSSVSVAANIAEGSSRQHKKDYLNFLYNARASLVESGYLLELSFELKYLKEVKFNEIKNMHKDSIMTLTGLIKAVKNDL